MVELFVLLGIGFLAHLGNSREDTNLLPGGRGDDWKKKDVSKKELARGIAHELEHTDDPRIATEVALDHLAEHRDYYTKLERAEKKMKPAHKKKRGR
jgi:hypothetical protein